MSKLNAHDKLINLFNAVAEYELEETMTKTTKQLVEDYSDDPLRVGYVAVHFVEQMAEALKEAQRLIKRLSMTLIGEGLFLEEVKESEVWLKKNGFEE